MNDLERVYKKGRRISGIKLAASEALQLWRQHCDTVHDASLSMYRLRIAKWHRETYPDCEWDIGSWHWRNTLEGRRVEWTGTDGIRR